MICKCDNPIPDEEYADMCGKCGDILFQAEDTETVIVKKVGENYEISVQHDQSGSCVGITISKQAHDKLKIELIKSKCSGNCGMNYCDENGCQDDKHPTGELLEKP